ncbi:MAG TPA: orotidine 5'-phosphate decarboxylase / HUMPS family protein, partial [Bacillales bacterium]|nr:orotidine 5'-phosphate decarboxylase / HUMPS family protein [Bacillales bacterium]
MENRVFVALDFPRAQHVRTFLQPFENRSLSVKVGMELFYQAGPSIVTELKEQGYGVFLDLKLHDIPNTVKKAMKGLAALGA